MVVWLYGTVTLAAQRWLWNFILNDWVVGHVHGVGEEQKRARWYGEGRDVSLWARWAWGEFKISPWRCRVSIRGLMSEIWKGNLSRHRRPQVEEYMRWSTGVSGVTFPAKANGIYLCMMDAPGHLEHPPMPQTQLNKYLLIEQTDRSFNSSMGLQARVALLQKHGEETAACNWPLFAEF